MARVCALAAAVAGALAGSPAAASAGDVSTLRASVAIQPGAPPAAPGVYSFPLRRRVGRQLVARGANGTYTLLGGSAARRLQDEVPLYGDFRELAYYYADVFVGTPPQKFTVITDTGSTLMAFPCADCADCGGHMDPKYDARASSTSAGVGCRTGACHTGSCSSDGLCQYTQSYAEGSSLSGVFYTDAVYIGDDDNTAHGAAHARYGLPAFKFGCHRHEGGLFTSQLADGIMGLGTGELSIIPALWGAGKLARRVFSLCMAIQGGALTLGAVDPALHSAPPAWAAMTTSGFYVVSVTGFALTSYGSSVAAVSRSFTVARDLGSAGFNSPHTILDSGTTFTYVPSTAYNALRSAIAAFCGTPGNCLGRVETVRGEPLCYRLASEGDIYTFPGMALTLAGADGGPPVVVDVPPHHLFLDMGWDGGAFCLAVYDNHNGGGVVGGNAMMGHDVIFDLGGGTTDGGGPRAGFAPSECVSRIPPGSGGGGGGAVTPSPSAPATPSPSAAAAASPGDASPAPTPQAATTSGQEVLRPPEASPLVGPSPAEATSATAIPVVPSPTESGSATPSPTGSDSPAGTPSASAAGTPAETATASVSPPPASAPPSPSAEPDLDGDDAVLSPRPTPSAGSTPKSAPTNTTGTGGSWAERVAAGVSAATGLAPSTSAPGAVVGAVITVIASLATLAACYVRRRRAARFAGATQLGEEEEDGDEEEGGALAGGSSSGRVAAAAAPGRGGRKQKGARYAKVGTATAAAGGGAAAPGRYTDAAPAGGAGHGGDDDDEFGVDGGSDDEETAAAGVPAAAAAAAGARSPLTVTRGSAAAAAPASSSAASSAALARAMAAVDEAAHLSDDEGSSAGGGRGRGGAASSSSSSSHDADVAAVVAAVTASGPGRGAARGTPRKAGGAGGDSTE